MLACGDFNRWQIRVLPAESICVSLCWETVHACSVTQSCLTGLFATPWTVACQAPLSIGLLWQEYWSGLPFPSPGDLPIPGIKLTSPALGSQFFPGGQVVKNPPANAGDSSSISGSEKSPGEGNGNPLKYLAWEIPWTVGPGGLQSMGSQKSQTLPSN